jgi:hypothetical protein
MYAFERFVGLICRRQFHTKQGASEFGCNVLSTTASVNAAVGGSPA